MSQRIFCSDLQEICQQKEKSKSTKDFETLVVLTLIKL